MARAAFGREERGKEVVRGIDIGEEKGKKKRKKKEWMRRVTNPEFPELRRAEKMCRGKSFCASDERCYMVLKFTHETKKKMKRGEKGDR